MFLVCGPITNDPTLPISSIVGFASVLGYSFYNCSLPPWSSRPSMRCTPSPLDDHWTLGSMAAGPVPLNKAPFLSIGDYLIIFRTGRPPTTPIVIPWKCLAYYGPKFLIDGDEDKATPLSRQDSLLLLRSASSLTLVSLRLLAFTLLPPWSMFLGLRKP
jgi:hypothetical protein